MVFNVNIGFQGLDNSDGKDGKSKKYSLFIGDTVLVNEVHDCIILIVLRQIPSRHSTLHDSAVVPLYAYADAAQQGGGATLLTQMKKKTKNVSIFLKGEDEQDDDNDDDEKSKVEEVLGRGARNVLASKTRVRTHLRSFVMCTCLKKDAAIKTLFPSACRCTWNLKYICILYRRRNWKASVYCLNFKMK